jgi:hypothetical protein
MKEITQVEWKDISDNGPARSRLLGTIEILGVLMHLEAIQVKDGEEHAQVTVAEDCEEMLDSLFNVFAPNDSAFNTLIIEGKEYVLFASPYC